MQFDELHYKNSETYEHGLVMYQEYIDRIEQKITVVRENYINSIKNRATFSGIVVGIVFLCYLFLMPSTVEISINPESDPGTVFPYILLLALGLAAFSLHPVIAYKHQQDESPEGHKSKITLKEITFKKAFQFFGDFNLDPAGGIAGSSLQGSNILPPYDKIYSEDLITGSYKNIRIEMCEAEMAVTQGLPKPFSVFKGMLVVLTLPAGARFQGQTVVIQDENKDIAAVQKNLAGMERIDLPTDEFEIHYEALTTNKAEATRLINEGFMETMVGLFRTLRNTSVQVTHTDDKIVHSLEYFKKTALEAFKNPQPAIKFVKAKLQNLPELMRELPQKMHDFSEKTKQLQARLQGKESADSEPVAITLPDGVYSINNSVQCSFYGDKVLLTIPYDNDLFEPNSVFEHAFEAEDITLTYAMMLAIFRLADQVTVR